MISGNPGANAPRLAGLGFDSQGDLFFVDEANSAVNEVAAGQLGTAGATPTTIVSGLNGPEALAFDGQGNLFIANSDGTVDEVAAGQVGNLSYTPSTVVSGLNGPDALAFDGQGDLFIANSDGTVDEVAAGQVGNLSYTPTMMVSGLNGPQALAFDGQGALFIASSDGTAAEVTASQLATPGAVPTTVLSGMSDPTALAFDGSGDLFIANAGNGTVSAVPGGQVGNLSYSTVITGLNDSVGLAFDDAGGLWIANAGSATIGEASYGIHPSAGGVMVLSSQSSNPMNIGGSPGNSNSVAGINLNNAELAQIVTTATGAVTFGDSSQTGAITFQNATPITTAGAGLYVQQNPSGNGTIILDPGMAIDANGGSVSLSAGTGGIVEATPNSALAEIATTGQVTLNTSGPIGCSRQPHPV